MNLFKSSTNISKDQVVLLVEKKNLPAKQETQEKWVQSLGWEDRSLGVGNYNLLQYSCLGNSMSRGNWKATVPGTAVRHNSATKHMCVHTHIHTHTRFMIN